MTIKKFEDLPIWKAALRLTKAIYDVTSEPRFSRDFSLKDQLRRAVISISANIVEGFEKNNNNEFIRYLKISKGSIGETRNHLYIANAIGYLDGEQFQSLNRELESLANQTGAFIVYLERTRRTQKSAKSAIRNP